jgi:hypothetical protein
MAEAQSQGTLQQSRPLSIDFLFFDFPFFDLLHRCNLGVGTLALAVRLSKGLKFWDLHDLSPGLVPVFGQGYRVILSYYQKELVESPPVFEGEIKIRLFITPILGLPGRGRSQTVNSQQSTVNC